MSRALAVIVLFAAVHVTTAGELTSKDMIIAWTFGVAHKNYSYYTFKSDHRYTGEHGDMFLRGTWRTFDHGRRLEMISGGGVPRNQLTVPPSREVIIIESFERDTLRVTLADGKKDVWKKMPRWKGSPKY